MKPVTFWRVLVLVVLAAAGARLAHLASIRGTAHYDFDQSWLESDMHANRLWAESLASGHWLDSPAFRPRFGWHDGVATQETWTQWLGTASYYQPPLYTYLLAIGLKVWGNPDLFRWAQALLGAVNVLLLGLLGRRVVSPGAGLIAAALAAGYAPFIFYDGELIRGPLVILLHLLVLLALHRASRIEANEESAGETGKRAAPWKTWGLAGAALGLTYVGDSAIVTFLPLAAAWAFFAPWRSAVPAPGRGRLDPRAGLLRAGFIMAGALAALLPLLARNVAAGAPLFSDTTRAPMAFVMGNAPGAVPVGAALPEGTSAILHASGYKTLPTILETLGAYHGDFLPLVRLQWEKLQGLFNSYEVPDNPSFYYAELQSPVLARALRFSCLSGLGLVGLLLSARGAWRYSLLHVYFAGTLALFVSAHVVSRYRQPLVIPLAIFAGLALVRAWEHARARRAVAALAILGGSVAISFALPSSPPPGYRYYRPAEFLVAAGWLDSKGEVNAAASEIKQAIKLAREEHAAESVRMDLGLALGGLYVKHERFPEALSAYRDVLDEDPRNPEALAVVGGIYQDMDEPMQALKTLMRAEAVSPGNPEVQARLGYLYWFVFKDADLALKHLRNALELAPNSAGAPTLSKLASDIAASAGRTP